MKIIDSVLLSKYIDDAGLNQSELARNTEISRGTICNLLDGSTNPSHPIINCIANTLDFTLEDFAATFFPNIQFKK